jgi:hypothetical protein
MSSSMMESKPVFLARCKSVGLSDTSIATLQSKGVHNMALLAFSCGATPGTVDDVIFVQTMEKIFSTTDLAIDLIAPLRRLYFEAATMAVSEVRNRYDRTEDTLPKKLPLPERETRRRDQQVRLVGVSIEGTLEPAHSLVDAMHQIREEDQVKYIDPATCISREQEVKGLKKEAFVQADSTGHLRQVSRDKLPPADLSTEFRLRTALQRRSLAGDQLGLMDYLFSEKYHTYLFNLLTQSVPDSHHMVTVQQLLSADKHIWAKMAELCREGVTASSGDKPMEEALSKALADPITVSILAPLPKGTSKERSFDRSDFRQAPYKPNGGKGRGDGKNNRFGKGSSKSGKGRNGKGKGSDFVPPELKGGFSKTSKGQRICFGYNLGNCTYARAGGICNKGQHVCAKCFSTEHHFQSCPDKS